MIHDLETRSIVPPPQADLKEDVDIELPFGFDQEGDKKHVMKLNTSIYESYQSSRNWFQYLTNRLKARYFFHLKLIHVCTIKKQLYSIGVHRRSYYNF